MSDFLNDAIRLLEQAKTSEDRARRLGLIELASDTLKAAKTETKKGVKNSQGEVIKGQQDLFKPQRGRRSQRDNGGVVETEADRKPVAASADEATAEAEAANDETRATLEAIPAETQPVPGDGFSDPHKPIPDPDEEPSGHGHATGEPQQITNAELRKMEAGAPA